MRLAGVERLPRPGWGEVGGGRVSALVAGEDGQVRGGGVVDYGDCHDHSALDRRRDGVQAGGAGEVEDVDLGVVNSGI